METVVACERELSDGFFGCDTQFLVTEVDPCLLEAQGPVISCWV